MLDRMDIICRREAGCGGERERAARAREREMARVRVRRGIRMDSNKVINLVTRKARDCGEVRVECPSNYWYD